MSTTQGVLAVITARGGSKGLLGKNIIPLNGLPLIAWTVRAALAARCIERVVVSTENEEIADAAREAGAEVPFMRPQALATDTASSIDVMMHALDVLPRYDQAVLLQPTSPFRTATDLDNGYKLWQATPDAGGCVSVCKATESPWLMFDADRSGRLVRILPPPSGSLRRQDLPKVLVLNGAFYFIDVKRFRKERKLVFNDSLGFEIPLERSHDIDTLEEFIAAEKFAQQTEMTGRK